MEFALPRSGARQVGGSGHLTLVLKRDYHPLGTNGILYHGDTVLCHTIELPWRENRSEISCIPEGRYRLYRQWFPKHGDQLGVAGVPARSGILIHPANNALRELKGCIAPVTKHTATGTGLYSRVALTRIKDIVYPVLAAEEEVYVVIST